MESKTKAFFSIVGGIILAIIGFIFRKEFNRSLPKNLEPEKLEDMVSEELYKPVDISKEEKATESQTQKINTTIQEQSKKIEIAKEDKPIKDAQKIIDNNWDEL